MRGWQGRVRSGGQEAKEDQKRREHQEEAEEGDLGLTGHFGGHHGQNSSQADRPRSGGARE